MAKVYLAEQISLGREVVLKVLDSNVKRTAETTERFLNEGRIIASLNHPHIITIYDIGQTDDKVYITMEFVEGGDLRRDYSSAYWRRSKRSTGGQNRFRFGCRARKRDRPS